MTSLSTITLSNSLTWVLMVTMAEICSWTYLALGGEIGTARATVGVDVDIRCGENGVLQSAREKVRLGFLSLPRALSTVGSELVMSWSFDCIVSILVSDNDISNSGVLSFLPEPLTCGKNVL